jgi:hypothetical protein
MCVLADMSPYAAGDVDYVTNGTAKIYAHYTAYDDVSGITARWMAISVGSPTTYTVMPFTHLATPNQWFELNVTPYNGMRMYLAIEVSNGARLRSRAFSNGFIVDLYPPICRVDRCVLGLIVGSPRSVKMTGATLKCRYSPLLVDMETAIEAIKVRGRCTDGANTTYTPWVTPEASSPVVTLPPMSYEEGQMCACQVAATDRVGHSDIFNSEEMFIDMTSPLEGSVNVIGDWISSVYQAVQVQYAGFIDLESPQVFLEVSIGFGDDDPEGLLGFRSIQDSGRALVYQASLMSGSNYTACMRATNIGGLFTVA